MSDLVTYEYKGIALTPRVFGDVLSRLAPGQMLRRSEAVNLVVQLVALAQELGAHAWPHKVGMTTVSVGRRIADQVGTALPERPVIVHTQEVEDAAPLERAVHAVLDLRGKRIDTAPGSEWFMTSAEEVRSIIAFCLQE